MNPPFAIALAPIADDAGSDEYTHLRAKCQARSIKHFTNTSENESSVCTAGIYPLLVS